VGLSPGLGTTVNILDGARIPYDYDLRGFENSIINILGGSIDRSLRAYDSSQVTVSGGARNWLNARGDSQVSISGGSIGG